jgi:trk system potassium uptake protein TrkA
VACTDNDERNIVACLAAQRMGAGRTVCVLNRPGFFSIHDDEALAESLGIDSVVRPAEQLADEIVRIVTVPGALEVEDFLGGRIRLLRYAVEENAPITAGPLSEVKLPAHVGIILVIRGEQTIVPTGTTHIQAGDKVVAMGRWRPVRRLLLSYLREDAARAEKREATVVGAGTVGFLVARGLEESGWHVKVIEKSAARCEEVAGQLKSLVLHGDGADLDLLEQEQIGAAPVLVAVANNDEKNLLVSLLGKQLGVERIVTRATRLSNEYMFERVGIDVVRSARGAAIRSIVRGIDTEHSEIRAELDHGDACVIELTLPEGFETVALRDIKPPTLARVGSIIRSSRVIIPGGNDELRAGDGVLIFCTRDDEEQTREFFLCGSNGKRLALASGS